MTSHSNEDFEQVLTHGTYQRIYVMTGKTDLRKGIDGLATLVKDAFDLDPFSPSLFLFCGTRPDRFKALIWEHDGFSLIYKRLENGKLLWPRTQVSAKLVTKVQLIRFLKGFPLDPSVHLAPVGAWY